MHDELRQLHQQVDKPSLASLESHAGHRVSKATFGNLLHGRGKPRLETVLAFVAACASYAKSRRPPLRLPSDAVNLDSWRARYDTAYPSTAAPAEGAFAAARRQYLARLRERYRRVDLEVLTPLTEQDDHPPVELREVFVAQTVRADPPPVELPRELVRRLVEVGELDKDDLPDGVDQEMLTTIRRTYQDRPARSVLQVLTESDQQWLVLLGDPGAGKSTLARYVTLALADASVDGPLTVFAGWLPLLVELRTYADARWRDRTFLDLIDHLHATEGLGLPKPMVDTFLRQDGRTVVIFDGLDELFDAQLRETVTHQIAGFAARYPRARIVVTSRVIGYRRAVLDSAGFAHHMLQDLTPEQI
ncbi:MAG: NACHT domain-containing protein, partial [Pseudonocardiaceae bacterium]